MADALHTLGVVSPLDGRLDDAGLIAVQGGAMSPRTGVIHGPGTTALITGTGNTAPMAVLVAAHHWVTSRADGDGVYRGALELAKLVPISAAPASGSRIDVIYEKQNDASSSITPDGTTEPVCAAVTGQVGQGKPSIPVGAIELGTVTVAAGATATNGQGVTISNTARQTSLRGVPIPVRSQAERDAITSAGGGYDGLTVRRLDVAGRPSETFDGASWHPTYSGDTGWVTVPTKAGFGNNQGGLQLRKIGKQVQARYGWSATGMSLGGNHLVATVPGGFVPPGGMYDWAGTNNVANFGRVVIDGVTGDVTVSPGGSALSSYYRLDNWSWLID